MDPNSFASFADAFDHWAKVYPESCAVTDGKENWSWLQLQGTSLVVASHVEELLQAGPVDVAAILSRRCCLWLAATVGLIRCGVPFVWMGCELSKGREKELQRNEDILQTLQPQLILLGPELPQEMVAQLPKCRTLMLEKAQIPLSVERRPQRSNALLCFQLTGGTTGSSKCVEVTQQMALHELAAYPKTFPELSHEDRVLQHTPVLWAASAIGQIDIAVSCGATLCIADTMDQESIHRHQVTILGCVPSSLEALQPSEVPTIRWIFTWGEGMPAALAQRWRSGDGVRLVELLISTEYWLSLYSEGRHPRSGRSVYKAVPGAEVAVLTTLDENTQQLCQEGTGELCLRGPMVTTGYRGRATSFVEATDGAGSYFKTSDIVTVGSNPTLVEFKGRSDMMIKVGAQFTDLSETEKRLKEALLPPPENTGSGVAQEVVVLPAGIAVDDTPSNDAPAHVFVSVLGAGQRASAARLLARARALVPTSAALHFLSKPLPKDPLSGKVDRASLLESVRPTKPEGLAVWPALKARLKPQGLWLLTLLLAGGLNLTSWLRSGKASRPGLKNLVQLLTHVAVVPYLWLFSLHLPQHLCRLCINYVPFSRLGFLCIWYHLARFKGAAGWFSRLSLATCTAWGASTLRPENLAPWWVVFWLAIPEQLQMECSWWLEWENWKRYMDQLLSVLLEARSRSISLTDNTIEAFCSAPARLHDFWKRRQERQLPYEPPEELELRPQPVIHSAVQEESQPSSAPQFQPVAQECDPEPSASSTGNTGTAESAGLGSGEALQTQEAQPEPEAEAQPEPEAVPTEEVPEQPVPPQEAQPEPEAVPTEEAPEAASIPEAPSLLAEALDTGLPEDEAEMAWSCVECRVPLPWGTDWRQEGEDFYCKSCFKGFDDRWWDFHTRDVVHLDPDDSDQTERSPRATGSTVEGKTVAGQELLRLLAKELGEVFGETRLSGIDSLAVMTLCRQLRLAAPGHKCLRPMEVFQCSTVGELLDLVDSKEVLDVPAVVEATGDFGQARTIWFAPGQVDNTCKWLYGCRGLLDPECFRRAAARLLARHEGLRAEMEPGGMQILRFLRDVGPLQAVLWQRLEAAVEGSPMKEHVSTAKQWISWSLKKSWPKSEPTRLTKDFLEERICVEHCRSWREVEQASQQLRESWRAPIAIGLFLLDGPEGDSNAPRPEDWGTPSSFLQFVVSHAYSDGFCSVPMVQDLASLYAQEEDWMASQSLLATGESPKPPSSSGHALLPLPPGAAFEVMEQRFFAAFEGQPACYPDQLSLRSAIFDPYAVPKWLPWVYMHEVLVEGEAVDLLRRCGKMYKIPFDVLLLSMVLAASFRASWQQDRTRNFYKGGTDEDFEQKTRKMAMPLTLYAPMRDGDLNDAMVGLFSDWRDLTVPCSSLVSLLGFCLDLADLIRYRRWTVFDPLTNAQNILVNILPLDEQVRGEQQFLQTRAHEYGGRRNSSLDRRRFYKAAHRPMRVTLEQEAPDAWWISLDLNASSYPTDWCRAFAKSLTQTMQDLKNRPMLPVLRADWASSGRGPRAAAGLRPPPSPEGALDPSDVEVQGLL